jgi:hypothetical protein
MYLPVIGWGVVLGAVGAGAAVGVTTGAATGELDAAADDVVCDGAAWWTSALHAVAAAITTASSPPLTPHARCALLMCAGKQFDLRLRDRRAPQSCWV